MTNDCRFSAVFIGSQSLLIQCAERFLESGHELRAVVSADAAVRRWAQEHDQLVIEPGPGLAARLQHLAFDYLFSVVHLAIVPANVLALPRKGAINFHDGPLPAYAGLNVTSWAILNQEREHGISWHLMEEAVDRGDILEQVRFPIDEDDTALTVNAKCFEAGLRSFGKLLASIETGTLQRKPQVPVQGRYYGRLERPANAAIIDWSQSADVIAALVRALNFGPYPNPLGQAKVWLNGVPLIVRDATVLPVLSARPPGTIACIAADALTVATADLNIHLSGFSSMAGRPVELPKILASRGLAERDRLEPLDVELAASARRSYSELGRHEMFWTGRLRDLDPIEIPYARPSWADDGDARYDRAILRTPHEALPAPGGGEMLLAALVLYFGRIGRKEQFDLPLFLDEPGPGPAKGFWELFAERVPLRVTIPHDQKFSAFRAAVAGEIEKLRQHGTYALDLVSRQPELRDAARHWHEDAPAIVIQRLASLERSNPAPRADLTISIAGDGAESHWHYRTNVFDEPTVTRMQRQFIALLKDAASGERPVGELNILSDEELHELVRVSHQTARSYARDLCVHELLEAQARRTPHAAAIVFQDTVTTYAELDARANRIAHHLREVAHSAPGSLVGVLMDRSPGMLAGMIGILKAGCAYVPLDPEYPRDRLAYMVGDAGLETILSQARYLDYLPGIQANMIALDQLALQLETEPAVKPAVVVRPSDLAYVIYTSGSTGNPKGVMVEHRNVVNFFAGMDDRLDHDQPGTWLAVTSTSFDISVLELFWTLARGFKVVLYAGESKALDPAGRNATQAIDFSLFYFSSDEGENGSNKYDLLLEGAKYADANGFAAVWTPERHFHAFGGLYPNPSVASAALAVITKNVAIRAGSCVLPLHNPIRVAEEWALVDNLSHGRAGISFASGWQPNDFVLAPEAYEERTRIFYEGIQTVRALWRGERIAFDGPKGKVEIQTLPRPVQAELPFWVTAAGNPETFRRAGEIGSNLLTHLLGQSVEELGKKLKVYRDAWRAAGHPGDPYATLMLHTFVADDEEDVRAQVEQPLKNYLRTATGLVKEYASSFPAFRKGQRGASDIDDVFRNLSEEDMDALLTHAFHRYYETSGLFGTPEGCLAMVDRLKQLGVDELACLIDFGCPSGAVLANLPWLNQLRKLATPAAKASEPEQDSIADLLERHQVTHLQCTPSLAAMLTKDQKARTQLRNLQYLLVGGEAFPPELASDLRSLVAGRVFNMYGPTETTIWSSAYEVVDPVDGGVPLGTPVANTQIYIVDEQLQPLPAGVSGEIVIGGDGVVRGYLNREELTAGRFVSNRFPGSDGGRLYRTGDRARWRQDGTLEFLGRFDNQVKLRGYRIELGEIEARLSQHPAVHQGVVVAREDTLGEKRLVGYIVPHRGENPSVNELREFLKGSLPEFMVPGSFVTLDELPLTPNKKVDRRALPAPDQSRPQLAEAFVAPRTRIEKQIAALWSDALGLKRIGVNDKFTDLGGDSLLAVEIIVRIGTEFDVECPLHAFFQTPTIAGLAARLTEMPEFVERERRN